jgi:hypothetical protein
MYLLNDSIETIKKEFINIHLLPVKMQLELYEMKTDILNSIVDGINRELLSPTIPLKFKFYKSVNIQKKTIVLNDASDKQLADKQREYALSILEDIEKIKESLTAKYKKLNKE